MDGAARISGRLTEPYEVAGKTYTLRDPGYLALMEEVEAHLVALRANPLLVAAQAVAALPAGLAPQDRRAQVETIERAAERAVLSRNRVDPQEVGQFLATRPGIVFALWRYARLDTLDEAARVFKTRCGEIGDVAALQELQAKIDLVSGVVEAKNSSGPGPKSPGEEDDPGAAVTA